MGLGFRGLFTNRGLLTTSLIMAILGVAQAVVLAFFVLYANEKLGYSLLAAGSLLTIVMMSGAAGRIFWGVASDRLFKSSRKLVLIIISGLVVSNIIAAKVIVIWKLVVPAAIIIYPFTFLLTDIIGELYGKQEADRTVWYGFLASVFAMVMIYAGMLLPPAPFMQKQQTAYELLLGPNRRIVLASLLAYLCSQKHDVWAFHVLKHLTGGRHKWLRNNLSTMVSQFVDTVIFIGLAFWGTVPHLGKMILGQYVIKVLIALLETPLFYAFTMGRSSDGHIGYGEKTGSRN